MKSIDSSGSSIHVDSLYIKSSPSWEGHRWGVFLPKHPSCSFGVFVEPWVGFLGQSYCPDDGDRCHCCVLAVATIQNVVHRGTINDLPNLFNIWSKKLRGRKNTYISKLAYIISEEFLQKSRFFRRWKKFMADYQHIRGIKRDFFPFICLHLPPPTTLRSASEIVIWKCAICRAILPMCGDDADVRERIRHAVSVSLTLVNTVVMFEKSRQKSTLRGFCVLAMSMGGAAEASKA